MPGPRQKLAGATLSLLTGICLAPKALAWQLEGELSMQARHFTSAPLYPDQHAQNQSLALELSAYKAFENGFSAEFIPFYRYDFQDDERSHGDIRTAFLRWNMPGLEVGIGINKVFWGVTEAQHLVDIINQTDGIEALDQEEKLGQPMLGFSVPLDRALLDIYLMPYFRERTFAGRQGRLRAPLVIDDSNPLYEHPDKKHHLDWAVRYKYSFEQAELALSYFEGTGRESSFQLPPTPAPNDILQPYYPQIKQAGLEFQYIKDEWLWKLEAIYRDGQPNLAFEVESYYGFTGGFEYNLYSIFGSNHDLGLIVEGIYDDRRDKALSFNEEDLVAGSRWTLNNLNSTEILALLIQDMDSPAHSFILEMSMQYGDSVALSLEAAIFSEQPPIHAGQGLIADNLGHQLRRDDYLQLEIGYYF